MSRRLLRSIGCALGLLALNACGPEPTEKVEQPAPSPLVYEIANDNGEVEGWMLGTIHALPDDTDWRTAYIDRVISEADVLFVEVADLSDSAGIAKTLARLSASPDLPDLTERVGGKYRAPLRSLVTRSSFSLSDFKDIETWAAALMLSQVGSTGDPANGVDRAVIADFKGREVREFEGAAKQLAIFDALPLADQRDLLEGVIEETQAASETPGQLRRAWIAGDEALLEEATTTGIMADPELREALLVKRNKDWAAMLESTLKSGPKPLVAVGAAHLVGPDGLPVMLEARGYTLRRIP